MAVGSINNKIKGNNAKNKYKPKNKKITRKKIVINELIAELDALIVLKEQEALLQSKKEKKHNKLLFILPTLILLMLIFLAFPKIKLYGDKEITINYNDTYIEPGYKASAIFKNTTKNVTINNNIINGKIGQYDIVYTTKYKFIKVKRKRIVNIIDDIAPIIEVDDTISVCPNIDIPDISFKAIDEYDGDLTSNVLREDQNEKILLSVSDKSNNIAKTEVKVIKEDNEAPTIELKGNSTMYLSIGIPYEEPGYTANDNCDGDITEQVKVSGTVNKTAGIYKKLYEVTDKAGNNKKIERTIIVRSASLYNNGSAAAGTIYLTFDDGPNEGTTNVILDILKEEGVKATFFVTCNGPDYLINRIVNEGHTIALHTATHNYSYIYSSVDNYFEDLNRVSNRVKNLTGIESKIIRFPGGSSNTVSRQYQQGIMSTLTSMVLDRGYRYYDWNVDSNDAGGAGSSYQVYSNVVNHLSYNRANMVLMHDVKNTTKGAIRDIIRFGKDNGYKFEKIDMSTYMIRHGVNN